MVLFLAVAAAALSAGIVLLGGTGWLRNVNYRLGMWDYTYTRLQEAGKVGEVDVLFAGSSHAYRSFDTRLCASRGLRAFNLGSSNQSPVQTDMLLRRYVDSLRPRVVVVEVNPGIVQSDGIESTIYLANNMKPSWALLRMALQSRNLRAILSTCYSAVRNGIGCGYDRFVEPTYSPSDRYVSGGFVESGDSCYSPQPHQPSWIALDGRQLEALRDEVDFLSERGIGCLLVEAPVAEVLHESYLNYGDFEEAVSRLGTFVRPQVEGLDDSLHFYDDNHLNRRGAELWGAYFCDSVLLPFLNNGCK